MPGLMCDLANSLRRLLLYCRLSVRAVGIILHKTLGDPNKLIPRVRKGLLETKRRGFKAMLTEVIRQHNIEFRSAVPTVVYQISVDNYETTLVPLHDAKVFRENEGCVIESFGDDPYLETQTFDLTQPGEYVLRVRLNVPRYTQTQFFYKRAVDQEIYFEQDSTRQACGVGENPIAVLLPEARSIIRIRFDPGGCEGRYVLNEFVILRYPPGSKLSRISLYDGPDGFALPARIERYQAWLDVNRCNDRCEDHLRARLRTYRDALTGISVDLREIAYLA